jgi:general secretion pathway protein N
LALILGAELTTGSGGAGPLWPSPLPPAKAAASVTEGLVDRWADTVLARPLFNADRRPERADKGHAAGLARLTGIIIAGSSRSAIFAAKGQKPAVVSEGGEIGGYRLLRISYDSVELGGATGTLILHPQFPLPSAEVGSAPLPPVPPRTSLFSYDNE